MRWLKRLWKLRKQQDALKMVCLFAVVGMVFVIHALYGGVILYHEQMQSTECIVTSGEPITAQQLYEIQEMNHVDEVSPQKETQITFQGNWGELDMECIQVSQQYLQNAFSCNVDTTMDTFYLNQTAWDLLTRKMYQNDMEIPNTDMLQISYFTNKQEQAIDISDNNTKSSEGTTQNQSSQLTPIQSQHMARVIRMATIKDSEEPYMYAKISGAASEETTELRVFLSQHDVDGSIQEDIQQIGLSVAEGDEEKEFTHQTSNRILRIQYEIVISCICFFAAYCIGKYSRNET